MADFLASVNWGEIDLDSELARLLGMLEGWTTEYTEGDLTPAEYSDNLRSVLSVSSTPPSSR